MSPLLRQFMLISIIGMTVLMLSLLLFYVDMNHEYMEDHLDAHNYHLATVLRNSVVSEALEAALVRSDKQLPETLKRQLDEVLRKELIGVPVTKAKVFNQDAIVVYSSLAEEIGSSASDNQGFLNAMKGQDMSSVVIRDRVNPFDQLVEKRNLHQQYIPIESAVDKKIIGVFEVYTDITEILDQVTWRQQQVFWSIALIMVLFYGALFYSFLKTHRVMERESQQRKRHLQELHEIKQGLEDRVLERTAELNASKQFLQSVIDGIGNALLVIRPDYEVSLMNEAAKKLLPSDSDPERFRKCYQISHRRDQPCEAPDHPCSFAEVMEKGCEAKVRHTHYDANDNPIIVDLLTTPLYSADGEFEGVIEVEHDITQLIEMQQDLEQSRTHLQTVMANVPDAILTCDEDCRIQSANQAALKIFNCTEQEIFGVDFSRFVDQGMGQDMMSRWKRGQTEQILKRYDGKTFPAEIWAGPLPRVDAGSVYVVVIQDITQRIQSQQELESTRQQYFHQEKMAAIGYLAAGILHEVGNPIAAIAGAASDMKSSMVNASEQDVQGNGYGLFSQNVDMIEEQTERLGKIIADIANFASPREQDRQLIDLNSLLRGTVQLMAYDRRFKVVDMQLELDKRLPAIMAVADQLTQVFMNLLMNAKDAFENCDSASPRVKISSRLADHSVEIVVEDNGCGMSNETLGQAVEAFFTTKPVGKGSGLGLSLCNRIVEMHGGNLRIESRQNEGSRVTVVLPIEDS